MKKEDILAYSTKPSRAHTGKLKNSVDFTAEKGAPIYATLDGEITYVKKNSKVGGPYFKYWNKGNRIVIRHKNEEYTAYEHMGYGGVKVRLGQSVKKGQLIGQVGSTGFSGGPHLHFELFIRPNRIKAEGTTIEFPVRGLKNKLTRLDAQGFWKARNLK